MRNHCYGNRRAGIGVRSGQDTCPVIQDNDCYSNGMAGIGAEKESQPVIRANRCYRNKMAGIGSRSGASPMIVGNECYENEMSGIGQAGNARPTLIDNHCHHNQLSGLGFDACERGVCVATGNRVVDNGKVAVGVQAGWNVTLLSNHFERTGGCHRLSWCLPVQKRCYVTMSFPAKVLLACGARVAWCSIRTG